MNTQTVELTNQELAAKFLALFKGQYRGIQSVTLHNGKMTVTSTIKSHKSLGKVSRDMAIAGFSNHEIVASPCQKKAILTCHKLA